MNKVSMLDEIYKYARVKVREASPNDDEWTNGYTTAMLVVAGFIEGDVDHLASKENDE